MIKLIICVQRALICMAKFFTQSNQIQPQCSSRLQSSSSSAGIKAASKANAMCVHMLGVLLGRGPGQLGLATTFTSFLSLLLAATMRRQWAAGTIARAPRAACIAARPITLHALARAEPYSWLTLTSRLYIYMYIWQSVQPPPDLSLSFTQREIQQTLICFIYAMQQISLLFFSFQLLLELNSCLDVQRSICIIIA